MRKYLILFVLCLLGTSVQAQKMTAKKWKELTKSDKYLFGQGIGKTQAEAETSAQNNLMSQICVSVSSQFSSVLAETTKGQSRTSEEKVQSIMKSYSSGTLNGAESWIEKTKPEFVVHYYIKKDEIQKMFKDRIEEAKGYAKQGMRSLEADNVQDALQCFSWAIALVRSCPDGHKVTIGYDNTPMITDLENKIKEIANNLKIVAVTREEDEEDSDILDLTLQVTYKGKPVNNLYLSYNYIPATEKDGDEFHSPKAPIDNGTGILEIPKDTKLKYLNRVSLEYWDVSNANINPNLKDIVAYSDMPSSQLVPIDASKVKKQSKAQAPQFAASMVSTAAQAEYEEVKAIRKNELPQSLTASDAKPYIKIMADIEKGIRGKKYDSLKKYFTDDCFDVFIKLMHYGSGRIVGTPSISYTPFLDEIVCRSIPMEFTFKGRNGRRFIENVVFHIDKESKVCEVAFGLEQAALDDINLKAGEAANHLFIINFLENYKTAYALKRLDYITSIFSDNALIITGSKVQETSQKELGTRNPAHIKYTTQTKGEYMNSLKKCFAANEYINIKFANNTVKTAGEGYGELYGIQIKQDYFSSNYGDEGYLFLLVDLNDIKKPMIHVRSWQPDLDNSAEDGRLRLNDFKLEQLYAKAKGK